ncbi:hypothetical protein Scep_014424 [Stephania cephalantha]|uniref:Uncharacterized protein n=1 Tax=Stephania cephalantha TaxID=152367 RepID=A0AAP0J1A1_9MAGN
MGLTFDESLERWVTREEKFNRNAFIIDSSGEDDDRLDIRNERVDNFSGEVGGDGIKDNNVGVEDIGDDFENDKGKKH